jgi:lysophospholipase L1-like esterase
MRTIQRVCTLVIATILFASAATAAPKRQYVDASSLTTINKAQNDGLPFNRIDVEQFGITKSAKNGLLNSTGLAIVFSTNSRGISVKWTTTAKKLGSNMTPIFHSGLDLYIKDGNRWVFAGVARPSTTSQKHEFVVVKNMAEGEKECMLYMPMFNSVTSLHIGIDANATIKAIPSPFKHKILFVGSSLTHGASAARPGLCYVARMGRMLNAETPNIGLSGKCKLDDYFANIVCATEADAYFFDTFSNSTKKDIENRLYNFVKKIVAAHPDKPMIFLQTVKRDSGHFDLRARKRNDDQRAAAEELMQKICKEFKNVYFINPGFYVGEDGEGTIDGSHLNDLGVQRMLTKIMPKVTKILKKYKIKSK